VTATTPSAEASSSSRSGACLVCGGTLVPVISLGRQPIANAFLTAERFADEFFYELKVGQCSACHLVQLIDLVDPSKLFHEEYAFFSGTSQAMASHFERFANGVRERHFGTDPFVVEIGSNDGIMLRHFADAGIRHLGVEPSANVAEVARSRGVRTVSRFFDDELARQIADEDGQADAVLGANVICHIPDLHGVIRGVKRLLKPSGVFIFEDPYLGDIVAKTSYDQIYDEHVYYFSTVALQRLFDAHGMEIVDVEHQPVHGGEVRYTVGHRGGTVSARVGQLLAAERSSGLDRIGTFEELRGRIERSRERLVDLLRRCRADGGRVVGYGATSKSTTVTNYCGIGPELVEYISDTTPIKQGKFSPGMHIPVRPYTEFQRDPPAYALLFAWNHAAEITRKESAYLAAGGRFIVYVPEVGFLP
jgi:methylation protein EvaC